MPKNIFFLTSKLSFITNVSCMNLLVSSPYITPQQNGIAKRKNKHLVETARILLQANVLVYH